MFLPATQEALRFLGVSAPWRICRPFPLQLIIINAITIDHTTATTAAIINNARGCFLTGLDGFGGQFLSCPSSSGQGRCWDSFSSGPSRGFGAGFEFS